VRSPAHHLEARTAGQGRELDLNRLIEERAQAFARSQNPERRVEDVLALGRQKLIRGAYADAAAALAATGKDEDRALAEDIEGFVADMPAAVSRRLERAREIMIADRNQASDLRSREKKGEGAQRPDIDRGARKPRDRER
jgi:hypothetical protein